MKTMKLLLLLVITSLTLSCNNDDDNSTENNSFYDSWSLIKVNGGFAGTSEEFEPGTIVWQFNENGTVTVTNNNTDEEANDYFESGNYSFQFMVTESTTFGCETSLIINDNDLGCFKMENNTITLDETYIDGYVITLSRQ